VILLFSNGKSDILLPKSATLNGVMAVVGYIAEFTKKTLHFCYDCQIEFGPVLNTQNPF